MQGGKGYTTHLEKIVSIEFEKTQMTYDVEMAAPYHNFVLDNGMVVSNSHAYCMALDSLYCAYLKAHYPYEFYEVMLQFYSDKGNKDKVRLIKQEMRAFGLKRGVIALASITASLKLTLNITRLSRLFSPLKPSRRNVPTSCTSWTGRVPRFPSFI